MNDDLILMEEMKQLGLSQYETKTYLALLAENPLNGYLVSKKSGVPRSKIYEVLDNLVKKQMIFEKKEEEGSVYYPLEPKLFIKKLKNNYQSILTHVRNETFKIYSQNKIEYESKFISGRKNIFDFINLLIQNAKERIDISLWAEEYFDLEEQFILASQRGVSIKGIYFGQQSKLKDVWNHRKLETYLAEKEERYLIIIIDNKEAITGIVSRGEASQVNWTNDLGIIEITKDYIVHDLMVNIYSEMLPANERNIYEKKLEKIRANYFENN